MGTTQYTTLRKKLTISTWDNCRDPTVFCSFDYDVTNARAYAKKLNKLNESNEVKHGKVTLTTVMTMAIGHALNHLRRDIGRIAWGNFVPSKTMGITILVDKNGKDLVPVTVHEV